MMNRPFLVFEDTLSVISWSFMTTAPSYWTAILDSKSRTQSLHVLIICSACSTLAGLVLFVVAKSIVSVGTVGACKLVVSTVFGLFISGDRSGKLDSYEGGWDIDGSIGGTISGKGFHRPRQPYWPAVAKAKVNQVVLSSKEASSAHNFYRLSKFVLLVVEVNMNQPHQYGEDQDEATVVGFEVPKSPDSSYNNGHPGNEDEEREPPMLPTHLHHTLLNHCVARVQSADLPSPQNVVLNHLYLENREAPRSVLALGVTHRFRSKYVTVVLYKPVQRRGSGSNS
ncbi:hypothetical protein K7X08_028296 [Anisodus acutangulus]|uniref:Association with the SNF1 complex (ASC) domain-containing protein n=1 Tax=Anisodus acutangulus TaxID=402998 RepID=A0A9Q1M5S4_9SOLA|nr:hypothetical protein K7X08_028296 [Anisodus acutangulus]